MKRFFDICIFLVQYLTFSVAFILTMGVLVEILKALS